MSRPSVDDLRVWIDLMSEKKVMQLKFDGIEITLHPAAYQAHVAPAPKQPKNGDEGVLLDPEPEKNPLRVGLRELAMREQINGRDVDDEVEFPRAVEPFEP